MRIKNDEGLLASMCEAIIEDANDILNELRTSDDLEPPTWWTSKLAVSSAYLNSLRDFIKYNKEEIMEEESEETETEQENDTEEEDLVDQPSETEQEEIEDDSMLPPSVRMMKNATQEG